MTATITAILAQRRSLCRSALLRTGDVNEAYIAVHTVMAHALSQTGSPAHDLQRHLNCALHTQAEALGRVE